jgi:hypothetical protein
MYALELKRTVRKLKVCLKKVKNGKRTLGGAGGMREA